MHYGVNSIGHVSASSDRSIIITGFCSAAYRKPAWRDRHHVRRSHCEYRVMHHLTYRADTAFVTTMYLLYGVFSGLFFGNLLRILSAYRAALGERLI